MLRRSFAIVLLAACTRNGGAQGVSLDRVRWLGGCWELSSGNRRVVERWDAPSRGQMTGSSRTLIGGALRESERLRLFVAADTLVYASHPSNQAPAEFRARTVTDNEVVFENLAHDFPQRIVYRRAGADSLIARIEGDRDGRRGPVSFPYRRVECTADTP